MLGDPDPIAAVQDAVNAGGEFDAAMVSTLPTHLSRWLKLDLPHRVERTDGASRSARRGESPAQRCCSSSATLSMCGVWGNMSTGRTAFSS